MQKSKTNNFLKFYSTLLAVGLIFFGISANAQLPYNESFKNSTATGLLVSGVAGDAFLTAGSVDPAGEGYLRLTNNQNNQSGFVRSTRSFPSANGLSISFDYFIHGGTGADGLSFFLYDSSVPAFNIGAFGGSLGYAQNASLPGVSKGFIALGLDVFGNFSNSNAGRQGGPGRRLSSVLLRGDGNGLGMGTPSGSNYEYLSGISTNNTAEMAAAGAGSSFQIAGGINGRTVPAGLAPNQAGYRRAKINMIPNVARTGFILNVWITEGNASGAIVHHVIKNHNYIPTSGIPANLSYGFSAGTGSASNFHEIRNLEIVEPVDPSSVPVVENFSIEGIQNVELVFKISDFTTKFSHPSSRQLTKIKIQNLPANGLLKLNGTVIIAGQEINVSDISQMRFVPESDYIGLAKFQWNGTYGLNYAITDAYVNLKVNAINPTFPYLESFRNSTAAGLLIGGSPNLAKLTSGNGDPLGAGYLQLTSNQNNQNGFAYSNRDFPSDKGLSIRFDYYGHGGNGSDGITFFLYDAAANPFSLGASGGAMGYAQNNSSAGLSKGFIGLSIDEYGNFSSPGSGRQGGPGRRSGSLTLRGDGDGNTQIPSNYEFLRHIQTNNAADMTAAGAGSPFQLTGNINGRTAGIAGLDTLKAGFRRIKMDLVPNGLGTGYTVNVWITEGNPSGAIIHHLINNFQYLPTDQIPANLRFGFSASSGAAPTSYEIRNLEILLPSNIDHKPVLNKINKSGFEDQPLTFLLTDFSNSFFDPKGLNTLKNVEFTSLPSPNVGILKLNGTPVSISQLISVSDISSGKLSFVPSLNYSGTLSPFKWNGHTATNKASQEEEVNIIIAALNDPPSSADNEVLIRVNHSGYVFKEVDFNFSDSADSNLHAFHSVKIVNLPASGSLKLNETAVNAGQFISADAIRGGQLKFVPGTNQTGKPYTSFNFQVKDNGGQANGGIDLDPSANIFKFNVSPLPTIELTQANPAICIGTSAAEIKYSKVTGDPLANVFSIDWDNSANSAGISDVVNKDLTPIITIDGLSGLAAGTYNGILTVKSKTNSIISDQVPVSISIMPLLTAGISYGADSFCASGKVSVIFTGDKGGKFSSESGLKIDTLTGEINLSESVPGKYSIRYSLTNNVCSVTANANLTVNALPIIAAITGSSTIVAGSSSQLNSNTGGGTWSSKNVQVASVNSAGLVTALKEGIADIVYKVKSGNCVDSVSFQINISRKKAGEMYKIMPIENVLINEGQLYTGISPVLDGKPVGKVLYSLIGKDSNLFNLDAQTGIVSMEAKDFSSPLDSDKDNVYEIGLNATDSDQNIASVFWSVRILKIQKMEVFSIQAVENVMLNEKTPYTSNAPKFNGKPAGKVIYSLIGKDSTLFLINESSGIVSMKGRDFDSPSDHDKNNVYEIGLIAKDSIGTMAESKWKVIIRMQSPSAVQSMLTPDLISLPLNNSATQYLTVTTKYANGESYLRGGEKVVFNKLSGSATIGTVTDLGNGTYTALINPGAVPGRSEFTATLGGKEVMNGSAIVAKVIIDFTLSDDNRLKSFDLSHGKLSPQFKADVFEYSALVDYSVDTIKLIPILNDQNAAIAINGIKLQKSGFQNIPLLRGKNLVSIYVTAADGISIQKYTITINRAEAVFPYLESFMGDIAEGLVYGGSPDKAKITSGTSDVTGMGYLSLTNSKANESGFVYNSKKFPTEKGLSISFEYYAHGGSGGDGLSFFLFDANSNFKIGAFGGALGYSQSSTRSGLNKGFLGLALDHYGEFSSNSFNKQGGPGRRPGSLVLRGDGNGISDLNSNYEYLTGIQTTDAVAMKLAGVGSIFSIFGNQNGRKAEGGALDEDEIGYRKLKIELIPNINKTGFIINVWITEGANVKGLVHHLIKNYSYIPTDGIPLDLKYGFAANNRNMTSSYEIRNLEIGIPDAALSKPTVLTTSLPDNFVIPEATNLITPNGDGINDNWIIRNIEYYGNNSIRIFNRFGQEVYRKSNYLNDWDGKKDGNPLPNGTYYYIFENSKTKQPLKGYITILE